MIVACNYSEAEMSHSDDPVESDALLAKAARLQDEAIIELTKAIKRQSELQEEVNALMRALISVLQETGSRSPGGQTDP
jgi:hypothetical protein